MLNFDVRSARESGLTCMRFMASRIWSRWWAELSASRRMSVSLSSFSLSSFFSWSTISASASVHSHSLQPGLHTGRRRGVTSRVKPNTHTHNLERKKHTLKGNKRAEVQWEAGVNGENRTGSYNMEVKGGVGHLDSESFLFTTIRHFFCRAIWWHVPVMIPTMLC